MIRRNPFGVFYSILLVLLCVQFANNASLNIQNKYKKFTGDQGLYGQNDDVEILTVDNFKNAIIGSKRAWLVEFYNSWCGFCQRFAPSWKDFATDVKEWGDLVVIAALDCSNELNNPICREYEIMSYPSLRYYHEGFQEEPKNYGYAMNRGVTAIDHRHDLVKKIISEQEVRRGKQYPNMLPYFGSNIEHIFEKVPLNVIYAVLIIHDHESLVGPELVLDLHKTPNIITRYAYSNNSGLISDLPSRTFPNVFIIGRDKHVTTLVPHSYDRKDIFAAVRQHLRSKGVLSAIDDAFVGDTGENKKMEDANNREKIRKGDDVVYQMDLETVLRYSLKREVGGAKEITGEKLSALRKYLQVLAQYFPLGRNGKAILQEISAYAINNDPVEGAHIANLVKDAEDEDRQVFSTPRKWLGCQGSTSQYRGYPCGLWTLFHYLTVNVADHEPRLEGNNPRLALEAMHGYIKHFFGCTDCSQHFQDMAAKREIGKVSSFDDSILWLWKAHNEVNKRLAGDATEDPEFPKIQFPSKQKCPKCYRLDDSWDENEALKYLKHMYSSVNINYQGADTKVIYLGLQGNYTTTHGGFLELDASIYVLLYIAILVLIFILINMFLKRGYRRKMYKYKHDLLGKV